MGLIREEKQSVLLSECCKFKVQSSHYQKFHKLFTSLLHEYFCSAAFGKACFLTGTNEK